MVDAGIFRRRHLPHWDVDGHPFFITACLAGSISSFGLQQIRKYQTNLENRPRPTEISERDWEYRKQKMLFAFVDRILDGNCPVAHLKDDRQAEIVQNAFLHFANQRYHLFAFVVMPSHRHWVFLPEPHWASTAAGQFQNANHAIRTPREIISHSIQSYTATMCNRVRNASGVYWQSETFDHWVRDESELIRIIHYIEQNPVAAGFVSRPEDWTWSSARWRLATGDRIGEPLRNCL